MIKEHLFKGMLYSLHSQMNFSFDSMRLAFLLLILGLIGCQSGPETNTDMTHAVDAAVSRVLANYPEAIVGMVVLDDVTGVEYHHQSDREFHAASTMKVPVMIEVFRRVEEGGYSLGNELLVENKFHSIVDSSLYRIEDDSDDAIYTKLGQKMTIRDLVFQMITVSSNLATNLLIDFVGADSVQQTVEKIGVERMKVLRGVEDIKAYKLGLSNTTTAADLALVMGALKDGNAVSSNADSAMVEILKAQAFNEMIPAGLPPNTKAAHKTGWITAIHHDAAIVYPENAPPYVLVILIEGLTDNTISAKLGADLTREVHSIIRG